MNIYSLKTMKQRLVTVIPRSDWTTSEVQSQQNEEYNITLDDSEKLKHSKSTMNLGCSIRYESVKNALNCVWHVIGVKPDSPAERASISSDGTDYIVGYDNRLFSEPNELTELLSHYQGISSSSIYLSLFIYNWKTDSFRQVIVNMSDGGHLGIELGTGYLHIIPPPSQISPPPPVNQYTLNSTTIISHDKHSKDDEYVFVDHPSDMLIHQQYQEQTKISNKEDPILLNHNPTSNTEIYSVSNEETNVLSRKIQPLDINIGFYNPTSLTSHSDEPSLCEIMGEGN